MEPLITFIATAHNEVPHNQVFLDSILSQTDDNWLAVVYHNGPNEELSGIDNRSNKLFYEESETDTGNYGCNNRQDALEKCQTPYVIQTSIQDYWLPHAVHFINKVLQEQQPDILIWNSINHLVGPCVVLDAALEWSKVDWGNFAIRTDIAKKVGINHGDKYCADFLFIQDVLKSGLVDPNKIIKMNGILTIHN